MKIPAVRIFLTTLVLMFLAAGCGDQTERPGMLRIAINDNPTNLDPRTHTDAYSFRIVEVVYDFLVRMDSTGRPELGVADSLVVIGDTAYHFRIRPGIRFHDGRPLSAYDIEYTFASIMDPALNAPLRGTLNDVLHSISVADSFNITFNLNGPHAPLFSHLMVGIVPKHLGDSHDFKRHPVGSGPFVFKKWVPDGYIELASNPAYWRGAPQLEGLIVKILPEATTRVLALRNDEIDILINNIPETQLATLRSNSQFQTITKPGFNYEYLGLNTRSGPLANASVRRAIAHAIDIEAMIEGVGGGLHQPANSLLNEKHWAYNHELHSYKFDPELANTLLDGAGYPDPDGEGSGVRFELNYKCTDKQASRQKALVVKQFLSSVGINVNIQSFEWGTFYDDISNGRFDMFSLQIVGIYEPAVYRYFFKSDEPRNRFGYVNAAADGAIELAELTNDLDKRAEYYGEVQKHIHEDLPCISLWHKTNITVVATRFSGYEMYPNGEWQSFRKMTFHE